MCGLVMEKEFSRDAALSRSNARKAVDGSSALKNCYLDACVRVYSGEDEMVVVKQMVC